MVVADDALRSITHRIYGTDRGEAAFKQIVNLVERFQKSKCGDSKQITQEDVVLITYGDSIVADGGAALQSLNEFASQHLKESFSAIHLLPFFPFSSDDGFSVIDYKAVNPSIGTWEDVELVGSEFELMFDFVLNHISAKSIWFDRYLSNTQGYHDLAIEVPSETDLSEVIRPRALPVLTPFKKTSGEQVHVWTTFSDDQIDLNYQSLDVLIKMLDVLLFYVGKGARMIRMDAVAYLWKQIGTGCIHLTQTHDMVRLFRNVLDMVAPEALIITETNVPHRENISYFGNGHDEAQMVYNFTLPPLLLYTFENSDATKLGQWAQSLSTPSKNTTFFNFTASHDGIGIRPLEGILSPEQINHLVASALRNGGRASYKHNPDGTESPYELNITYVDAMGANPERFLASQAIAMVLPGVPAVYIHSLIGSRNWHGGVNLTGRARTINREQVKLQKLIDNIADPDSFMSKIFYPYCHLLKTRRAQPAFHPNAQFYIIDLDRRVMSICRASLDQKIYALTNVSADKVPLTLVSQGASPQLRDLLTNQIYRSDLLQLAPYQTLWLVGK